MLLLCWFDHFLDSRAEICQIFRWFFGKSMTPKRHSEINWLYLTIQYGYIIEAAISYYPIRNGWKLWYRKSGLFYYKSIQDCRSYDLQNIGLKIHNFSLELKQSKTPPAASCWIISTLVRRYVFFNPRCCKSRDWPTINHLKLAKIQSIFSFSWAKKRNLIVT